MAISKMLLDCILALVVLINPVSKIFVITTFAENSSFKEIRKVVYKASFIAAGILILFTVFGNAILRSFFHVDIYSLKIAGGLVLLMRGYQALDKGLFFEISRTQKLEDLSIVPLASPMIAGPATITAAVSFPAVYGLYTTLGSIVIAVAITLLIMLLSDKIGAALKRFNIMGALIRITGLIVATIGVQMILSGVSQYIATL